jgi:hypothetical protein
MSRFAIYETNALPLGKATSTIDVGAFGETEAVHSIAIFTDTVTLQFGAAYELGAGTQDFAENAVADAWVEYSYIPLLLQNPKVLVGYDAEVV